jgi:Lon protease-like protein
MSKLLPLFPLQLVVFPRTQLPLHIFEERYKEMVGAAIRDHSEFGIVLAKDEGIVNAGCTVAVEKVITEYPDGRLDVMTQGRSRFEIIYINQEKSYLQGQVEFFDDEDTAAVPTDLKDRAIRSYREFSESAETRAETASIEDLLNDSQLSFHMAQAVPDLDLQSRILRSRSEVERLQQLTDYLQQHIPRLKETARMRVLAPRNGFGRKIAGV